MTCVSAKASLSTFPDWQRGKQAPGAEKKTRAKHHYWPEHHAKAEIATLVFGRLLVLDREREVCAPPRESNGG